MNEERAEHIRQAALTVIDLCMQLQHNEFKPALGCYGSCSNFNELPKERREVSPVDTYALRMFTHYVERWSTLYGSGKPDFPVPAPKGYRDNYGMPEVKAYYNLPRWPSELKPDSSVEAHEYVASRQDMLGYIERQARRVIASFPKDFVQDLGVLHLELKRLQSEGPTEAESSSGICDIMNKRVNSDTFNVYPVLQLAAEGWPMHSGDSIFPVPGVGGCTAEGAFGDATVGLWIGEYGDLRRELLGWLVDNLLAVDANNRGLDLSYLME